MNKSDHSAVKKAGSILVKKAGSILKRIFPSRTRDDLNALRNKMAFGRLQLQIALRTLRIELRFLRRRFDDMALQLGLPFADPGISVETSYPVAYTSNDHLHPRGTGTQRNALKAVFTLRRAALGPNASL